MTNIARFLDHNTLEPWDLLFKDFFNRDSFFAPAISTKSSYPTDIYEDDEQVTIEVAAAGLNKEDIRIEECDGLLSVSYDKTTESKENDENCNYHQRGIAKRSFSLSWKFSDRFDLSKIEAEMDKGILKISVPKIEQKEIMKNLIKIK